MKTNPYLLTILSGLLLVLCFPPYDLHYLAWFALAPFLYGLYSQGFEKRKKACLAYHPCVLNGLLLGIVFYYGTLWWLCNVFGPVSLALIFIICIFTGIYGFVLNFTLSKTKSPFILLLFPAVLWVAVEYLKSVLRVAQVHP